MASCSICKQQIRMIKKNEQVAGHWIERGKREQKTDERGRREEREREIEEVV